MSGPIVRTGTTPEFWRNWDQAFGGGSGDGGTATKKKPKKAAKETKKAPKAAKKPTKSAKEPTKSAARAAGKPTKSADKPKKKKKSKK